MSAAPDLGELGDALTWSGLGEYAGCFDPLKPRQAVWRANLNAAPTRLRPLVEFFLLNQAVSTDRLSEPIRAGLIPLAEAGLIETRGHDLALAGGLVILPVFGRWVICHPPRIDPRFYLGDDTVALLARLAPLAGGSCLDLCAGPGALALHAAGVARRVTAVEKDPSSACLARLNASLNRLSARIEVLEGDLYDPVAGRRFDTVVANPPLLPLPDGLGPLPLGDGGADGLAFTRAILEGLADALTPGGVGLMIGAGLGDGRALLGLESLARAGGGRLDLTVSLLSHRALDEAGAFWTALTHTVGLALGKPPALVQEAYRRHLAKVGASSLCHLFVHARLGRGLVDVIDLADAHVGETWRWRSAGVRGDA